MAATTGDTNSCKAENESKQLRWTKAMDRFVIEFLVEEANRGNKVDKSFKKPSIVRAAKEVSQNFKLVCTYDNVENRMKTIKKNFKELKKLESNNSGMSWDDTRKMWKCSESVHQDYVRVHPKGDQFLNKPIFMYDELHIVCGDDHATGSFSKSSRDDNFLNDEVIEIGLDDITTSVKSTQLPVQSPVNTSYVRKHGKRVRSMDEFTEKINLLAEKMGEVADAIKSSNGQEYTARLYDEVMKTEGFDEETLESAFDYLNENDKIARSFLVKNASGRQRWLKKYLNDSSFSYGRYS